MDSTQSTNESGPREPSARRLGRAALVLLGIILGQVILYGPSLIGQKILLPLDVLAGPGIYLPRTPEVEKIEQRDWSRVDQIYAFEPARRFAAAELRAGRLPIWMPSQFAGTPFPGSRFSPFLALESLTPSPVILAWSQLAASLVAGLGAYLFFRLALDVGFWPAAICAWCYPVTGFFVFWQGYSSGQLASWFPWLMLAVDQAARGDRGLAPVGLSAATCLVVISGQLDVAGQALLGSGLYGLWRLWETWRGSGANVPSAHKLSPREQPAHPGPLPLGGEEGESSPAGQRVGVIGFARRQGVRALTNLAIGWGIGLLLAAPAILPVVEHTRTGSRMARRATGTEERPPVGLAALPQAVLPEMYGSSETGSYPLFPNGQGNLQESSAAAYTGVVATLFAAPMAFFNRKRRRVNWFWAVLAGLGLSWCVNVPGLVYMLRLPGVNMMSHNRLVFWSCFAFLALAAMGLEVLEGPAFEWRRWAWLPSLVLLGLCGWCVYWAWIPPEPVHRKLEHMVRGGIDTGEWVHNLADVKRAKAWFVEHYAAAALWCGLGTVCWGWLRARKPAPQRAVMAVGFVMLADLFWFAYGRSTQSDPALYFPPIPVLEQVAKAGPGRVIGYDCLPSNLTAMCGLRDVRGYDAVDPRLYVELLAPGTDPKSKVYEYALTQWLIPRAAPGPDGTIRLYPVFDLLGVRFAIFRGKARPDARPIFQGNDYWVMENRGALPHAFVPSRVEFEPNAKARLTKLGAADFDPRAVAYVESPITLSKRCEGNVEITGEIPTRVTISVSMATPGLVVLADRWDQGWRAYLNGSPAPILRANHALRGVLVPVGNGTLEFRYEPASLTWGLRLAGSGAALLLGWIWKLKRQR